MQNVLSQLSGQTVVVVGDVMVDRYLTGTVSRISPEAPVPVLLQHGTEDRLGGAANVALNIRALGSTPILCSVVGDDRDGSALVQEIFPSNHISTSGILRSSERRTTVKTRVLGNRQQMLRIDNEDTHGLSAAETAMLLDRIASLLDGHAVSAIILQDYNKGVLTEEVIGEVLGMAARKGIFTAVDPKKDHFFAYKGASLFKPNLKEVRESLPFEVLPEEGSLRQAAAFLREKLGNRYTMLTLSENGLFFDDGSEGKCYPTNARRVADVSGAGDTVISVATLALAAGMSPEEVARLSNLAGGQVCEVPGVVPVDLSQLEKEWLNDQ
jgi:ADP-heptose synthase, bifunctional sugar kinase/adenylyltransferase